jgi:uncharacterized protein (DUF1697 family)
MVAMPSYVAFLRAINLGATRKFPKDDIRACVESTGATEVATHINTGNVLLTTTLRSRARVEAALEDAFLADRGFEVPTIAYTVAELRGIASDADDVVEELGDPVSGHYVTLLKDAPSAVLAAQVAAMEYDGELARVRGRAVHLVLAKPYNEAKLSNAKFEKSLGVGTTRNVTVIRALADKWC